ncbi:MAG: hypothetical protein JWQ35_579 [Bacteriovoracaceae bacterium]|nr:hypothetical protein [Bacteriovoracaceae bacterium]
MRKVFGVTFIIGLISFHAKAESDYQLTKSQQLSDRQILTDETEASPTHDSEPAKMNTIQKTEPAESKQGQASLDVEMKIKTTLNSFSSRMDETLRKDLEHALKTSLIGKDEVKASNEISAISPPVKIEQKKESLPTREIHIEKSQLNTEKAHAIKHSEMKEIKKENAAIKASAKSVALEKTKNAQERIAQINKALTNPRLEWGEFEKLLTERKNLETQVKASANSVASKTAKSEN